MEFRDKSNLEVVADNVFCCVRVVCVEYPCYFLLQLLMEKIYHGSSVKTKAVRNNKAKKIVLALSSYVLSEIQLIHRLELPLALSPVI